MLGTRTAIYFIYDMRSWINAILNRDDNGEGEQEVDIKNYQTDDDLCKPSTNLSTILEDCASSEHEKEEESED